MLKTVKYLGKELKEYFERILNTPILEDIESQSEINRARRRISSYDKYSHPNFLHPNFLPDKKKKPVWPNGNQSSCI